MAANAANEISLADAYGPPQDSGEISLDEAYGNAPQQTSQHDLIPFLKGQAKGIVSLAKQAGSGLVDAVSHPEQTATDIANSVASSPTDYMNAISRTARNIPVIGPAIDTLNVAAQGVPALLRGEGQLGMVNAQDAFEQKQKVSDLAHAQQHPLTDFVQKSIGLVGLPQGHVAQTGIMAVDAFTRSLNDGNDVLTALKDARNAAVLVGTALQTGKMISNAPRAIGKWAAKEAGVQPEAIARYMEAPEAVNAAEKYAADPEALKNLVDDQVAPINQAVDTASNTLDNAKEAVAATRTPPQSIAAEIPEHLDAQGAKLHELSSQAFDILSKEGQTFSASDLSGAIQNQMDNLKIAGVTPSIGPDAAAYGALGKFKDMVDQIGQKIGGGSEPDLPPELAQYADHPLVSEMMGGSPDAQIPAPVVKQLIQQLDGVSKDAYSTNAGALSPSAAKNLASVRKSFDSVLKATSFDDAGNIIPGSYADKMAELAPKVDIVQQMSQVFGDEPKAMLALKAAADPMSPRGIFVRDILNKYDAQNGTDFAQRVADYYDKPQADLQQAQTGLQKAQEAAQGVNKLGPNSTENTVKSVQAGRNYEARKQLENLNPDLAQTVSDTGVAKQFMKDTTNGSRKAKIGAGIGGAAGATTGAFIGGPSGAVIGGFVGQGLGGAIGGLADKYGGQAVKTALDAGIKLEKIANTPYIKPIMEAAQSSPKSLAVVHYTMSQTDPGYQALSSGQ